VKLNHFICPNCGHDFYTECAYATCDACNCMFYASQSKTCEMPSYYSYPVTRAHSYQKVFVNGIPLDAWLQRNQL
jgi:hypothetical protein